jgi:aryl-alcohol dehydrogenase-like predicted oxidoreductase
VLPTIRELGIGLVAYSPLGRGFLTGRFGRPEDIPEEDFRHGNPRFQGENFYANLRLVERVREIAKEKDCTPGQLALAWVLHRGADVVPIPGTKRRTYLEQNVAATEIELSEEDLRRLDDAAPAGATAGDRYADMSPIGR